MFGKNDTLTRIDRPANLSVKRVFYTIQREGPSAGSPAVVVHMAGCHLSCYFCDTDFTGGTDYSPLNLHNEIVEKADGRTNLVIFTGGEPLRQNLCDIFTMLDGDWRVQIETAGTFWWDWMALASWNCTRVFPDQILLGTGDHQIVCSPKTAEIHPKIAENANAFVYITRKGDATDDGLPFSSTQFKGICDNIFKPDETVPKECIYVQPMDLKDEELNKNNETDAVYFSLKHGYRISLRMPYIFGIR